MDTARIASLLSPFLAGEELTPRQLRQVSLYLDLLLKWTAKINLTSLRSPDEIITRHFGESFFLAAVLANIAQAPSPVLFDIGAGAGFPGLPVKIYSPSWDVTLIESRQKKATFLKETARVISTDMNMSNPPSPAAPLNAIVGDAASRPVPVHIFDGRAQDYLQHAREKNFPQRADFVTLRAVERFQAILPVAASLVRPDGRIALLIGESQLPALNRALAFTWDAPQPVPLSQSRLLVLGYMA